MVLPRMDRAPVEQAFTHSPQTLHLDLSVSTRSPFKPIACQGQVATQAPQPMHRCITKERTGRRDFSSGL